MSYHGGPTSPSSSEIEAMSPVPQRTPKRRRVESGNSIDLEPFHQSPPRYSPTTDSFNSGVFSPVQNNPSSGPISYDETPFPMTWDDMDFSWDPPIPLSNTSAQNPQFQSQPMPQSNIGQSNSQPHPYAAGFFHPAYHNVQQNMHQIRNPPDAFWNMPPTLPPMSYHTIPPVPYRQLHEHHNSNPPQPPRLNEPVLWAPPQLSGPPRLPEFHTIPRTPVQVASQPRQAPPPPAPRKGGISLTLSRANPTSIEELPEHKRECPACQLEFESDDYLAVISCCGTAMHAACMSAWVNSGTYAKTKVCMKCRKLIDARRALNQIVPPVTDKSWDRGPDFTAPETVQAGTKIQFDISGRTDSATRRHYRREMANYIRHRGTASVAIIPETDVPARSRGVYRELLQGQRREMDELELRYRNSRAQWRAAFEAEAQSASAVSSAKDRYQYGSGQHTHQNVNEISALSETVKSARKTQEQRHSEFRAMSREYDEVKKRHQTAQLAFLERVTREMAASEAQESSSTSSD